MPSKKPFIPAYISDYLQRINAWWRTPAEEAIDRDIQQLPDKLGETAIVPGQPASVMAVPAEMANYLAIETKTLGRQLDRPMKALDIGTFSGSAALAMAQAMEELPQGGEIISCEIDPRYAEFAKEHWRQSPAGHRIRLKEGPALDTIQELIQDGQRGTFDLIFIDADKLGYDQYYEKALELLRPGGMVVIDNALWSGQVADTTHQDPNTLALRTLNDKIKADNRVDAVLTGNEDGVWTVLKRDTDKFQGMVEDSRRATAQRRFA